MLVFDDVKNFSRISEDGNDDFLIFEFGSRKTFKGYSECFMVKIRWGEGQLI